MNNNEIRRAIKTLRNALSVSEVQTLSESVTNNVLSLNLGEFKNVFIYRSFKNEVDTNSLIQRFLTENKVVAFPVIQGEFMVAGVPKNNGYSLSKFGTEQPSDYDELDSVDISIIPLLACDNNKNRLGYGKGYYDKFLSVHPCLKIGLCYNFQVVDKIDANVWDVPLDIIVTDKKIIK